MGRICVATFAALALLGVAATALGFGRLQGDAGPVFWEDATATLNLQLGNEFNQVVVAAAGEWNSVASTFRFEFSPVNGADACDHQDGISTVGWEKFSLNGSCNEGAIFRQNPTTGALVEFDLVLPEEPSFLDAWAVFSGENPRCPGVVGFDCDRDLRRELVYLLGFVLGLEDPTKYGQTVVAIMNGPFTGVETPRPDDIAGVNSIYPGVPGPTPTPMATPTPTASPHVGGLVGVFERPKGTEAGVIAFQGWTYTTTPGASVKRLVEIFINGEYAVSAPCCSDRGDVRATRPGAPLLSGFSATFNLGLVEPFVEHEAVAYVRSTAGEVLELRTTFQTSRSTSFPFAGNAQFVNGGQGNCTTYNWAQSPHMALLRCSDIAFERAGGESAECRAPGAIHYFWDRRSQTFTQYSGCTEAVLSD